MHSLFQMMLEFRLVPVSQDPDIKENKNLQEKETMQTEKEIMQTEDTEKETMLRSSRKWRKGTDFLGSCACSHCYSMGVLI